METGKIRDNQNTELNQLNQDYQRRKEKLIDQRDAEISQIKNLYNEKEDRIIPNLLLNSTASM